MTTDAIEAGARADLLPCPFCGGEAIMLKDHKLLGYYVACTGCHACGKTDTKPKAVEGWNTRASGTLVTAAQLAADHLDHLEGGLQLLLAAAKAGDPHNEIAWRAEEELRQVARLRAIADRTTSKMEVVAAVAAERERCAQMIDDECARVLSKQTPDADPLSMDGSINFNLRMTAVLLPELSAAIRALEPASGDYVVVPRAIWSDLCNQVTATDALIENKSPRGDPAVENEIRFITASCWPFVSVTIKKAMTMLTAATKDGERGC